MNRIIKLCFAIVAIIPMLAQSQVNSVEFGKNRIQYKKYKWKFYQSPNFNTYIAQGGTELGKYVAQVAEEELISLENFTEYSLQRRANLIVYNSYDDYKQSNVGLGTDFQNGGGETKLVNNKLVVYFDGNHNNLKLLIRKGIARALLDNVLFGDDIGEIASNAALLDLPQWLTDGYVAYAAENWSTAKDDELKSAILGGEYTKFYQFAYDKPQLAGHAFWNFIADKYKKENITYFLYLARIYKSLNKASLKVCKKKFKEVLDEFMQYEQEKYYADLRGRRNQPKGQLVVAEDVSKNEYYRFQINPNVKSNTYAAIEYRKGIYSVKVIQNFWETTVLLRKGILTRKGQISPNYPILSWDVKGQRLLVIYFEEGKTKMFIYDMVSRIKRFKQEITGFDQIVDASFMLDANTVILSAVKNGHTDIFTYKIEQQKTEQITNDVYDDLNPTYVTFPNRAGIIFSSNRPGTNAPSSDTVLPSRNRFNVFMVDILNKGSEKQITQLTNVKNGNASFPMQYNTNHFTFVSDENGIGNRWAGFFSTQRNGLDTLYRIGDEVLRNPSPKELDSTLTAWQRQEPDSVSYFQVYKDSTYAFPITNYSSSLLETRIAGNNGLVSEVRREGDYKYLYKLKVDDNALNRRNINLQPTDYMKSVLGQKRIKDGKPTKSNKGKEVEKKDTTVVKKKVVFQTEFEAEKPDSSNVTTNKATEEPIAANKEKLDLLSKIKLYNYGYKFSADYVLAGVSNNVLINRYQTYGGGSGPIQLGNGNDVNLTTRVGVSDVMEDIKFIGGFRIGTDLKDKDVFASFQNFRRRLDWGATYFRTTQTVGASAIVSGGIITYPAKLFTNLYQGNVSYPIDETKRVQVTLGYRNDNVVVKAYDDISLKGEIPTSKFGLGRIEYVYDNTLNPAQNIWNGLRYKFYLDINTNLSGDSGTKGKYNYNFGLDARHYLKIYRNFIWATRAAADFSWGNQKMIYYLGGVDGWINPKFNDANVPAQDQSYAFQTLAVNMRGFKQNVANGNNAVVLNSELRFPVFTSLLNKPINNAFVRNFQLIQFVDLGTAWNGKYSGIKRPYSIYTGEGNEPLQIKIKAGGIGPFVGGYGFGARSTLLGYFIKLDAAWEMNGVFRGKPSWYFALGLDF